MENARLASEVTRLNSEITRIRATQHLDLPTVVLPSATASPENTSTAPPGDIPATPKKFILGFISSMEVDNLSDEKRTQLSAALGSLTLRLTTDGVGRGWTEGGQKAEILGSGYRNAMVDAFENAGIPLKSRLGIRETWVQAVNKYTGYDLDLDVIMWANSLCSDVTLDEVTRRYFILERNRLRGIFFGNHVSTNIDSLGWCLLDTVVKVSIYLR